MTLCKLYKGFHRKSCDFNICKLLLLKSNVNSAKNPLKKNKDPI